MAQNQAAPAAGEVIGMNKVASPSSLNAVKDEITPIDQFYVRDHFGSQVYRWRIGDCTLRVEIANRVEFAFSDLLAAPTKKLEALLECAGNKQLLVSHGIWEGVPMSYLLEQAAPTQDSQQVMLEGPDAGPLMPGLPSYPFTSNLIPLSKCLAPETLVAFRLNGQFLPPRNGFPARALLPGWYGMDSIKWLATNRCFGA